MTALEGIGAAATGFCMVIVASWLVSDSPHPEPLPVQPVVWERPAPTDPFEPDPLDPGPLVIELCVPPVVQVST